MTFDTQTLTRLVERCFELSMSGALPQETRVQYLAHGKRLRELLMRLLGARFDADSAEFKQASAAMDETNRALSEAAEDLDKVTQVVGRIATLAGYLDKAIALAGRVIT
ncbi:hypothetical protein [Vitiosangium sp. GDMCC 1.1324]|uniref:hypothetical protein n=1 Tax=Vitiosangium sp. (strain GDMCC 1.1324) TaxID=2138576 RepID=UPI000D392FEE|nr:hypothetical protein [Vitiosangium sp. GDMCC 1.1324]PTL83258.1 hypothetical protein DAT35_14805 [Vitiosangium sp. GDMCC 1.1324]